MHKKPFNAGLMLAGALVALWAACTPFETEDIDIGSAPTATFSMAFVAGDSNRVVVSDLSAGAFVRHWDFGNGATGSAQTDTAYFPTAGTYTVKLYVSARGGTGIAEQTVVIAKSDQNICNDSTLIKLTGGCDNAAGKGWTFSTVAGAISVGPTPGSSEWYSSPAGGLVPEQYDDTFRFFYEENHFLYENNGLTVFPELGYQALPYDPPTDATWQLSLGTGLNGADQIILPAGSFMGVKDSKSPYDIVELTEDKLVVVGPFLNDGGYFKLSFVRR